MMKMSAHSLFGPLRQGLAVTALLAAMALMAFAAGLALLGAMIALPISLGFMGVRQILPGEPKASDGAGRMAAPAGRLPD